MCTYCLCFSLYGLLIIYQMIELGSMHGLEKEIPNPKIPNLIKIASCMICRNSRICTLLRTGLSFQLRMQNFLITMCIYIINGDLEKENVTSLSVFWGMPRPGERSLLYYQKLYMTVVCVILLMSERKMEAASLLVLILLARFRIGIYNKYIIVL